MTNPLIYVLGLLLVLGMGLAALVGLIVAIVMAAKGKMKAALVWGLVCVVFGLMGGGLLVGGIIKARQDALKRHAEFWAQAEQEMRDVETGAATTQDLRKTLAAEVKALTPEANWARVDEQWFIYDEDPDWNRIPVRWPYEVRTDVGWDAGQLRKNVAQGKSKKEMDTERITTPDFDMFAAETKMILYRLKAQEGRPLRWGMVVFETERMTQYPSEEAMWTAAQAAGWTGAPKLETVERRWDLYWGLGGE